MAGCHVQPEQMFNLIWGYNDRYVERVMTLAATAGDNQFNGSTVPAGEVWVVTSIGARDNTSVPTSIWVGMYNGTNEFYLENGFSPAVQKLVSFNGLLILKAGDNVRILIRGATLNDDIYIDMAGYKMKVSQ